MRKFSFFLCLVFLSLGASVNAEEREGYVTALRPPSGFTLGGQQVLVNQRTEIYGFSTDSNQSSPFRLDLIQPGNRLAIKGKEDTRTRTFLAQIIDLLPDKSQIHISGTGQEDKPPALTQEGKGWHGNIYVDGYAITVTPETYVTFPANGSDFLAFHPNWRVHYEAARQRDASILASKVNFVLDDHAADVREFRAENDYKIDLPDYDKGIQGTVHFFLHSVHIIPNKALNEKVTSIGESLVPAWQKQLDDKDPGKIHFRFYILEHTKPLSSLFSNDAGTVLIPIDVLLELKSEAQLASLLAAQIASSIGGYEYRSRSHKDAELVTGIGSYAGAGIAGLLINKAAYSNAYWKPLAERTFRVGIQYMVAAGYDPRQASIAQQRITEKHPDGKDHPNRLSEYIDTELAFRYQQVDFNGLRTGETEYAALLDLAKAADPKAVQSGKTRLTDR
ncbi:MAG TPA: DUF5666 domain-containing protein [Pseudacidobacterium sp.]|jgi:hypothetical protein|nr:DUF5666 domain-containing protein [Pseudacidobacterium sp.]